MNTEEKIEKKYEKYFSQLGETNPVFTLQAKTEMANMVEQIARTNTNLEAISGTNQTTAVKAGFGAEELHAESYNLDAILNGSDARASTDKYPEWGDLGLKTNDTPDIVVAKKDGEIVHQSQSKYYRNSEKTANAMREIKDGKIKYEDMDSLLGPSDQINPTDGSKSVAEEAHQTVLKESGPDGRKNVEEAAKIVEERATDKIEAEGNKSTPISKKEAEDAVKNPKTSKKKVKIEKKYQDASTVKQMKNAAKGAATISAIMSGSYNVVHYCNLVKQGKISEKEAVYKILAETSASAADSAVKASVTTGIQSTIIRYSSKEVVEKLAEQSLKGMMRSNVVTIGVVSGIDAIKDLVRLGAGKITKEEFYERQGKGILNTGVGVTGGSVGFSVGSATAMSLGYSAGSTGLIVMGTVGGIAGGLIAGLAMQIAIENHIEKTYYDLLKNTNELKESLQVLQNASKSIFQGQLLFEEFLKEDRKLDENFAIISNEIKISGQKMSSAIDDI